MKSLKNNRVVKVESKQDTLGKYTIVFYENGLKKVHRYFSELNLSVCVEVK